MKMLRTLQGLAASDPESVAALKRVPTGSTVNVSLQRPRNMSQHRLYWALCQLVADHHEQLNTSEQIHETIKLLVGHCDVIALKSTGEIVRVPRSISFSKMTQLEFQDYFKRAKDAVVEHLLPGVNLRDVEEEVLRMVT